MSQITIRAFDTFDDPAVSPDIWGRLLNTGETRVSSLTWHTLKSWWQDRSSPGHLRLLLAQRDGHGVAIAPLFIESGMAMNLCPANYLDFVGDVSDPEVLDALLSAARQGIEPFVGWRFYYVPDTSHTGQRLRQAAERMQLECHVEDEQPSPIIDIRRRRESALACTRKKTVLRREAELCRNGALEVCHFAAADEVLPQLDDFFDQHVTRWAETSTPSRFADPGERDSFRFRTERLAEQGSLRFARLDWQGRAIAYHRGSCFQGHYKYGRTSYDVRLAHYSPGMVLLRHLILAAIEEDAHTFDFGIGDESYKDRYATDVVQLQTWGLYPMA